MSERLLTDTRFDSFDLPEPLIAGLEQAGFSHCTPIRRDTLPILLAGQDVLRQAQTGTGKTFAFLVAGFERLLAADAAAGPASGDETQDAAGPAHNHQSPRGPRALILAPTRELVIQIKNDADKVGAALPLKLAVAYGGVDYEKQRDIIAEGVDVLVGTPGRLIDYFKQGVFRLDQLSCLVLDEADRMFYLGFIKDIRYMMRRMLAPDRRLSDALFRHPLFSASRN
jgi:Superfamily II DNA and RNA helicases